MDFKRQFSLASAIAEIVLEVVMWLVSSPEVQKSPFNSIWWSIKHVSNLWVTHKLDFSLDSKLSRGEEIKSRLVQMDI
jgi:hypothetical protein